ncbi:MAG TPA: aminotransferase class III-fold pyridoxal phosphate-dependent enzyme, partial [Roseiflexaceae bacterium]|nr:aminotransferase class III-fold pyridoxal phosphate-dependent enzyme [Roseiflexaceae bacterium]
MSSLTEQDALRLAHELYNLRVAARRLPGEYDDNFHLTGDDQRASVLKVTRVGQAPGVVDLQCRVLTYLADRAPTLVLPRVCPTPGGEPYTIALVQGVPRLVWMLSYVPGQVLAEANPHSAEMLHSLGRLLGRIDAALVDFAHPAAQRDLKWDLARAGWIREYLDCIEDSHRRALVERCLSRYEHEVVPALGGLRASVIHGDANDYNVLVDEPGMQPRRAVSLIDFGDMLLSKVVCEPAIAAAYALLGKRDPLSAAAQVVAGYHSAFPLTEAEIALLYPLICARLSVSVTNAAQRKALEPDDPYITISEAPAWDALERLSAIHPRFAHYTFRQACGLPPVPYSAAVVGWLQANAARCAPVLGVDLRATPSYVFDLSVGSLFLGADPAVTETAALSERIARELRAAGASVGVGRYDEARLIYATPAFASGERPTDERRTIHLGVDLFAEAGAPIFAPLEGEVYLVANNAARLDYGPLLILKHSTDAGQTFFTLYGHLGEDALEHCSAGRRVAAGDQIGSIGAPPINGDWPPHLHFQIITDLLDLGRDFPGVAYASQREIWKSLSPDPNLILGVPAERFPPPEPSTADTLSARRALIGRNLSISYQQPLKIVRGWMQYLYDETGRAFLDVYNNVPLVGHSHPRVVRAAQSQLGLLNTNTRYLHDNLTRYAGRLTALMPEPLSVCFILNSASEANELALRLARAYTGHEHVIVLDAAYHGHTGGLIDISPYKFNGPGGTGPKPWVHVAPIPDDYRGAYKRDDPEAGVKYARHVAAIVDQLQAEGHGLAAYIAETLPSVGGQIVFPPGYLAEVYRHVRAAGGVCIADEVQVGFGRLGTHFWGFETQGVVPDIVVLGKPIGNGFPLAAVVTTPAIAGKFDNGMEFFSTFGGNPVACAAGLAVLDVLRDERLQEHALRVGGRLLAGLRDMTARHVILGDARGSGLFLGVELVRDRATREPAPDAASYVVNRLRDSGILAGIDGPHHNVIKIRPPLPFGHSDAE